MLPISGMQTPVELVALAQTPQEQAMEAAQQDQGSSSRAHMQAGCGEGAGRAISAAVTPCGWLLTVQSLCMGIMLLELPEALDKSASTQISLTTLHTALLRDSHTQPPTAAVVTFCP